MQLPADDQAILDGRHGTAVKGGLKSGHGAEQIQATAINLHEVSTSSKKTAVSDL